MLAEIVLIAVKEKYILVFGMGKQGRLILYKLLRRLLCTLDIHRWQYCNPTFRKCKWCKKTQERCWWHPGWIDRSNDYNEEDMYE